MIEYRTGDLFDQGFTALAQGVNCRGWMNAGIAKEFRRRWPAMYASYRNLYERGELRLGEMHGWRDGTTGMVIFNLATQDRPGPHADLDAIRSAAAMMLYYAPECGLTEIGLPRIGAGIGGLDWADVAKVLEDVAQDSPVRLVVMSLPGADGRMTRW